MRSTLKERYAAVMATIAVVVAVTGVGAAAAGEFLTGKDLKLPAPQQLVQSPTDSFSAQVGPEYALVDEVGTFKKREGSSVLGVTWSGEAHAAGTACVFQLRVDGEPSSLGGGDVNVQDPDPVSVTALFKGLKAGTHSLSVWAKHPAPVQAESPCTVGLMPTMEGSSQTFVLVEHVR